jgi:hypothetical protein
MGQLRSIMVWVAVTFGLNLVWEVGQILFYTLWAETDLLTIANAVVHCSLGDLMIAAADFLIVAARRRRADWFLAGVWRGGALALSLGLAYTVWSEWRNVFVLELWTYSSKMPVVDGVVLLPLLQWIVVPIASWAVLRRSDRRSSA